VGRKVSIPGGQVCEPPLSRPAAVAGAPLSPIVIGGT